MSSVDLKIYFYTLNAAGEGLMTKSQKERERKEDKEEGKVRKYSK
jgi:hypothetical protein